MDFDRLKFQNSWCNKFSAGFKLNAVVNALNLCEDMDEQVAPLEPQRLKIFQVAARAFNENFGPGLRGRFDFASFVKWAASE